MQFGHNTICTFTIFSFSFNVRFKIHIQCSCNAFFCLSLPSIVTTIRNKNKRVISLQAYMTWAIVLRNWKIVLHHYKICKFITIVHLHIFLHQRRTIAKDSYANSGWNLPDDKTRRRHVTKYQFWCRCAQGTGRTGG